MRFLHSLLYSLFIWVIGVLLGSLLSSIIFTTNGNDFMLGFSGWGEILLLMLVYSALFSFPAFILVFIAILILNPRKKRNFLITKIILSAIVFLLTAFSFFLFLVFLREASAFLLTAIAYCFAVLLAVWVYPLAFAAGKLQPNSAAHLTVAQYRSPDEKDWFQQNTSPRQ